VFKILFKNGDKKIFFLNADFSYKMILIIKKKHKEGGGWGGGPSPKIFDNNY
jgi:hypothetical protein